MSHGTYDIIIVGGGLSGLSLAAALAAPAFSALRVLVLEQRHGYARDRTWSYWPSAHHAYSHLERMRWSRWRVSQGKRQSVHVGASAYCSLDADAFYQAALGTIAAASNVEMRMGLKVHEILPGDGKNTYPTVATDNQQLSAQWVFDARARAIHDRSAMVQQFVGWEVETPVDVFDDSTVELMAFERKNAGLHFFYVLPYSARNALVETTWISPAAHRPDFEHELQTYLQARLGAQSYKRVYEERGALQLTGGPPVHAFDGVVPLGRRAGTLRAATGYAFLDTLAHTDGIASSLAQTLAGGAALGTWTPPHFARGAADRWMDRVFLNVLQSDWAQSSLYFLLLFERVESDTLVAFLSGRSTWRQRAKVAWALPTWPFVKAAIANLVQR